MRKHSDFIRSDISWLLEDAVNASQGIQSGIGSFAICDYVFQSLFLRMTGYQEQKFKCVCWDMATDNYDFRRDYLQDNGKLGEMSSAESKKYVYQHLLKIVSIHNPSYNPEVDMQKEIFVSKIKNDITHIFAGSLLSTWNLRDYKSFTDVYDDAFKPEYFATTNGELLGGRLITVYDMLYKHRNRCAHNLMSYQQNVPTLKQLAASEFKYENYYIRFAVLMLIDRVIVELYNKL